MTRTARVAVVVGSTRPTRIGADIASWVLQELTGTGDVTYELLDLAGLDLPFLDEPRMPTLGGYAHEHTWAWSRQVSAYDGFVFVTPQYNWGYPAVLKNALDFLYAEWRDKPAAVVSYGFHGGGSSATQLLTVLQRGLHMHVVPDHVELVILPNDTDDDGKLLDPAATLAPAAPALATVRAQLEDELLGDG